MQHDLVWGLLRMRCISSTPIIADRICKNVSIPREAGRADRSPHGRKPLQPVFSVLVPEVKGTVTACGAESAVLWMEGDGVNGVDATDVAVWPRARRVAVTFEGKVEVCVFLLNILDGAAAFDAADCKAHSVGETADDSGLVFQRRLEGLVKFGRFVEVDDVNVAIGSSDDEESILDVQGVDALLVLDVGHGGRAAEVPVLDRLVPRARHEHLIARGFNKAAHSDRLVVSSDLLGCGGVGGQVNDSGRFIDAGPSYLGPILEKMVSEKRKHISANLNLRATRSSSELDRQRTSRLCPDFVLVR